MLPLAGWRAVDQTFYLFTGSPPIANPRLAGFPTKGHWARASRANRKPVELSPRELEVLELVADGLTNEAIAARLCLSVRTVERHLSNVYAKLRVSGKAGRAAAAVRFSESLRAGRQTTPGGLRAGADAGAGDPP